jgi:hypothetical protein
VTSFKLALLFSGGIGDYMHYLTRWDNFLIDRNIAPADIAVFVESTVPAMVRSIFEAGLPGVAVRFVPAQHHWTKTHPLLDVLNLEDRQQRPAFRYVQAQGFHEIVDWFLPFCCDHLPASQERIVRMLSQDSSLEPASGPAIGVSLRDKGSLWWPHPDLIREIAELCRARSISLVLMGTPNEKPAWLNMLTTASDVLSALRLSASARLFISTDTGLATVRELLRKKTLYCLTEHWLRSIMMRYRYITPAMLAASGSRVVFDGTGCRQAVHDFLNERW